MAGNWAVIVLVLPALLCTDAAPPEAPSFPLMAVPAPPLNAAHVKNYNAALLNTIAIASDTPPGDAQPLAVDRKLRVLLIPSGDSPRGSASDKERPLHRHPLARGLFLPPSTLNGAAVASAGKAKEAPVVACMNIDQLPLLPPSLNVSACSVACFAALPEGELDEAAFYTHLERARVALQGTNAELWANVQVTRQGAFPFASESDLRLQVFSALAFGARGICYERYWPGEAPPKGPAQKPFAGWGESIIEPGTFKTTYLWSALKRINGEILALAPALNTLRLEKVFFVGEIPVDCTPLPYGQELIRSITAEKALVALFMGADDTRWAMLINRRHGVKRSAKTTTSTLQVFLSERVQRVVELDRGSGKERVVPVPKGHFMVTLPGGTGCLVRLEVATPG